MKWIILLFLLFLLAVIFVTRFRKQINGVIILWKTLQKPPENQIKNKENEREVPLVKCADCGTWIPQTTALITDSKRFFCSQNCLRKAVKVR